MAAVVFEKLKRLYLQTYDACNVGYRAYLQTCDACNVGYRAVLYCQAIFQAKNRQIYGIKTARNQSILPNITDLHVMLISALLNTIQYYNQYYPILHVILGNTDSINEFSILLRNTYWVILKSILPNLNYLYIKLSII
jgi:hypothetical protein